jgi:hypothetical protein
MTLYELVEIVTYLLCILIVLAYLAYNKHAVAAWWHQRVYKELRDAAPWADPRKVRRVYRGEIG